MIRIIANALFTFGLLASAICFRASAQYSIDWIKVSGGASTSTSGVYCVSGTVGQSDAGTFRGDGYSLEGGFWPGVLVVCSTNQAPTLVIQLSNVEIIISWAPVATGFALEEADDLSAPVWGLAPSGNPVTISTANGTKFYRLRKP